MEAVRDGSATSVAPRAQMRPFGPVHLGSRDDEASIWSAEPSAEQAVSTNEPSSLRKVIAALRIALDAELGLREHEWRTRRRVEAIDDMLAVLEDGHLSGKQLVDDAICAKLREVETEVGRPFPRDIRRGQSTIVLHGQLLDWQDRILDEIKPWRHDSTGTLG